MIVTLATRRRAQREEILMEAQVVLRDLGEDEAARLVRLACARLTTPPDKPTGRPKAPISGNGTKGTRGAKGIKAA